MKRTFAAHGRLVHDPATGMTHHAPDPQPIDRLILDDTIVASWPVLAPGDLDRQTPASVCWSPIVRCNLYCPQCLDDTTVPELSTTERHRIAGVLADANVLGVDISGGEPLLLRDLTTLLSIIRDGGRSVVSVTTNGWHLARRARELARCLDAVRISLDGPDPAQHDAIRGAGSFARATDGIRAAVAEGIPVQIQTVLMHRTAGDLQDLVDLAHGIGAGGFTALQMLPIGAGAALSEEMLSDDEAGRVFAALRVPTGLRVRLRTRDAAGNFTVVRADGRVWRNASSALSIGGLHPLRDATDLILTGRDGTA
jgi:MoaA/NifB/PqqE/SkfB family radical SAM enzyme